MEVKNKPCKGTGLAKGYGCNKGVFKRTYGLCSSCYYDWLINSENGKIKLKKSLLSAELKTKKIEKQKESIENAFKEKKERSRLTVALRNTMNVCHEYIRERDKGKPCISCGIEWLPGFNAGHFYKAELYSMLKFDENNINGQCQNCNLRKDGNENGYRLGLMERYGADFVKKLDEKAIQNKKVNFKWDIQELKEIQRYYKEKLASLKNNL